MNYERPSFIYVVQAQNGFIKVGVSANPESRAYTIHVHSPIPCRLIAKWPGSMADEQAVHRRLAEYRIHSEWFAAVGDARAFVAEVFGRGVEVGDWVELTREGRAAALAEGRLRRAQAMRDAWANPEKKAEWLESLRRGREIAAAGRRPAGLPQ